MAPQEDDLPNEAGAARSGPRRVASRDGRRAAVNAARRDLILEAARSVFEAEGLEGASMRAIGTAAGYTAAGLYFHFPNKEAVYAALLEEALDRLTTAVAEAASGERTAARRFKATAMAVFDHYARFPRELDLGFYLFRGGIRRRGLSPDLDAQLNARLLAALAPIDAAARQFGATDREAREATVAVIAHVSGLLLLDNTGRLRLFGGDSRAAMVRHVDTLVAQFKEAR